jgi:acetyltransferase-like isoleucine patch superfamily enzyme
MEGAGSVVTADVPLYVIVAGAPARPVKGAFEADPLSAIRDPCAFWS